MDAIGHLRPADLMRLQQPKRRSRQRPEKMKFDISELLAISSKRTPSRLFELFYDAILIDGRQPRYMHQRLKAVDAIMNRNVIDEHCSEPANDERVKRGIFHEPQFRIEASQRRRTFASDNTCAANKQDMMKQMR